MKTTPAAGVAKILLWAAPFFVAIASWCWGAVLNPLPFWQIETDYSWLSLSHAFTVESKIEGIPAINHGYRVHPGIPFGFVSWISLRLATLSAAGAEERITYGLVHAQEYWSYAKAMALALNLGGLAALCWLFRGKPKFYLMAATAYLACLPAVHNAALYQLSNESLALLYMISFYTLAYVALSSGETAPSRLRHTTVVLLGVMTVFGWSIKIYYLGPSVGLLFGVAAAFYMKVFSAKALRVALLFYVVGLLVGLLVIVLGFMGWDGFAAWFNWNWKMLSHTGRYGTSDEGFLSGQSVFEAVKSLTFSTKGAFPALVGVVAALAGWTIFRNRTDRNWMNTFLPFSVAAFVGIALNLLAVLKHYAPHYGISVVASLGCLFFIISTDRTGSKAFRVLYVLIPVGLALTLGVAKSDHIAQGQKSAAVLRDIDAIFAMPMEPGKRRIWAYFSASREGTASLVSYYAGSPFVDGIIKKAMGVVDSSPNLDPDPKDWQYVIFPKKYYPTREAMLANYKKMFDFKSVNFQMAGDEKVTELETFLVVKPNPAAPQPVPTPTP